jgi:hypothetical protein
VNKPIQARNLSAQLQYQGAGNPPTTHPSSAISNSFPGLEMDFRNVWKRILAGIELHEASNLVVGVDSDADIALQVLTAGYRLITVADVPVIAPVTGPAYVGGPTVPLPDPTFHDPNMPLEWSNALAGVLFQYGGKPVRCKFQSLQDSSTLTFDLIIRKFFAESIVDGETFKLPVISRELAPPGSLSQSLCSPWQNDYRECGCFYWAATRPDYVNIEAQPDGTSAGNNWMQKNRTADTPLVYVVDDRRDERLVSYSDLFRRWETELRFIIGGKDEESSE